MAYPCHVLHRPALRRCEMTEFVRQPRFIRKNDDGETWMVWDRVLNCLAMLKEEELDKLAFSAAETLMETLNADNPSD